MLKTTRAEFSHIIDELKNILFGLVMIVQTLFLIFYGYSIYSNLNRIIFLCSYSALLILSTILFIDFIVKHIREQKQNKTYKRITKFSKYLINGLMLIVNIIQLIQFGASTTTKILLIISGAMLIMQLITECTLMLFESYIKRITKALERDFAFFEQLDPRRIKGNILEAVSTPIKKLADWKEGREQEQTKEDKHHEKIIEEFEEKQKKAKAIKKVKKQAKREKVRQEDAEKVKAKKEEIKDSLKRIFKKKKDVDKEIAS